MTDAIKPEIDPVPPEWTGQGTDADFFVPAQTEFSRASQQAGAEGQIHLLADTIILTAGYQLLTENNAVLIARAILSSLTSEVKG